MRKSLSLFKLYSLANRFALTRKTKKEAKEVQDIITAYLRYVNEHKYEDLGQEINGSWINKILTK